MTIAQIIRALMDSGMTQPEIAAAVSTTQPTISRALNGSDVRYRVGKKLEQLYKETVVEQASRAA